MEWSLNLWPPERTSIIPQTALWLGRMPSSLLHSGSVFFKHQLCFSLKLLVKWSKKCFEVVGFGLAKRGLKSFTARGRRRKNIGVESTAGPGSPGSRRLGRGRPTNTMSLPMSEPFILIELREQYASCSPSSRYISTLSLIPLSITSTPQEPAEKTRSSLSPYHKLSYLYPLTDNLVLHVLISIVMPNTKLNSIFYFHKNSLVLVFTLMAGNRFTSTVYITSFKAQNQFYQSSAVFLAG